MKLKSVKDLIEYSANFGLKAFPPAFKDSTLERQMKANIYEANCPRVRLALVFGVAALILFAIIGQLLLPSELARTLTISRLGIELSFIVVVFILTYTEFGKQNQHHLFGTVVVWVSFSISLNILLDQTPIDVAQYYPGLLLVLFFGYIFIRGNWFSALAAGFLVQIIYLTFAVIAKMELPVLVASNIYILFTSVVGATGNYMIEHTVREAYWNQLQFEQKQKELEKQNKALDQLVQQRTRELKYSQAFVSNIHSGVASDLKAPLNSAMGYFEIMQQRNQDKIDEVNHDFINEITRQCTRVKAMIDSLVEYSSIQGESSQEALVDLNLVAEIVLQKLNKKISEFQAKVSIGNLPTIHGNEHQLTLVFFHLLDNAIKFHGEDPPEVTVRADYLPAEACWQFAIRDQGIGIPPKHQQRIFEFFSRLDPTSERSGIGMGLAISKHIIEVHGGKLWLESLPEKGTTVFFQLDSIEVF